jgi:hypothetical protein
MPIMHFFGSTFFIEFSALLYLFPFTL